ncbi:MAG: polyprenyl synthetase family protein [Thermoguttaceae bacterium]|nr:polyprenyl synthetase family protein [Thermoguttaceae bacterium]
MTTDEFSFGKTTTATEFLAASYLEGVRREFELTLDAFSRFDDDSPKRLTDAARYSLLAPGKRLRPTLVLLAAEACGGKRSQAKNAAVAVEAIHAYSLIHDDLPAMDNDDLRRGRPTCWRRFDEATAILAGDALQAFAFEVLATSEIKPSLVARCVVELARAAGPSGMVGGQADDVLWSAVSSGAPGASDLVASVLKTALADVDEKNGENKGNKETSEEREKSESEKKKTLDDSARDATAAFLRKIHRRKTGALIVASLRLGALTAGASEATLRRLALFGGYWGQAFQISDDLLDAIGDEAKMGKRVQKDAEAGKLTYVSLFGVDETRRLLKECVGKAKLALKPEYIPEFDGENGGSKESLPQFYVDSAAWNALNYLADYVAERDR